MPLSRDDVISVYRYVLGREPESEAVIDKQIRRFDNVHEFRIAAIQSLEFRIILKKLNFPLFDQDKWVRSDIRNGLSMWVNLRDIYVSRACLNDNWEEPVVKFIFGRLEKGDIFVDIGANIGWFTLLVSQKLREFGSGRVVAFEPRNDLYEMAARSVRENGLDSFVTFHNCALADREGESELAWTDGDNPAVTYLATKGIHHGGCRQAVRMMRLDDISFPGPVRLIKSDAEGAEGLIYAGAQGILAKHRPTIVSELSFRRLPVVSGITANDFLNWMRGQGYSCRLLGGDGKLGASMDFTADTTSTATEVVFLPNELPATLAS
jgi:FkbM family methyltransferase